MNLLEIKNLSVKINDKSILNDFNLTIAPGEIHALMGPNGSGKSTLAYVLAGKPEYEVTQGEIYFEGKDLLALSAQMRSLQGLFLAMQYPIEIPGLNNSYFIKAAVNAHRKAHGLQEIDAVEFLSVIKEKLALLNMPETLLHRALNDGFSGGEKKCNEILQFLMLEPKLAVLDETDSGLDIDTLKTVANAIKSLASPNRSTLIITHYQRLLNYIEPDKIHIMIDGKIVESGDKSLAHKLESHGYSIYGK
jgi:Fe-S cluster assembly ATP-binding protein